MANHNSTVSSVFADKLGGFRRGKERRISQLLTVLLPTPVGPMKLDRLRRVCHGLQALDVQYDEVVRPPFEERGIIKLRSPVPRACNRVPLSHDELEDDKEVGALK